ncbi:unnamed protein product [Bemisia tabaci]|uniref:Integrator complex subunit 2 n=1 Tax=Bemisia tabaci TaxID=7038 RepID=A0A9P0A1Y1_BEMTA|nr:unnamed protein product [Bemisia tabaci]
MNFDFSVSSTAFRALLNMDVTKLTKLSEEEIRPILPSLVRMGLISVPDSTLNNSENRRIMLAFLLGVELVNSIVALLSVDFNGLEADAKREQLLRQKIGNSQAESILAQNIESGIALDYERGDSVRRLRLVLSELLFIQSKISEHKNDADFYIKQSDLFDYPVFVPEVSDAISLILAELPCLLSITDMVEILLHVKHGPDIICWTVANFPDCFNEVAISLISNCDKQEEDNGGVKVRTQALSALCEMYPPGAFLVRSKCVELCRMPALTISLTLDHGGSDASDLVAFVSGLLLGNDQFTRNWFAMFIRNRQKRNKESNNALQSLRTALLHHLEEIVELSKGGKLPKSHVVQASALLRLYCALRGIAGIKFQENEISLIVQLLTSQPTPSPEGVRFVSLGLCMLIACPSLISIQEHETKSIEWVRWLVKEEAYFESASGISASFGEMLLLMAIHFHSNQLSAICDLVCSTIGMKIPIRHNTMARMKVIFTQEIFTEQVVTSHAVKVPVTTNLNGNISGFLPIHCIHQLLKSRAFTKYKVSIKDWIYRQICSSVPPLHPCLPALVEVYVNSILFPVKRTYENTNQPISEDEIRIVFRSCTRTVSKGRSKTYIPESPDSNASLTSQLLLLYYVLLYEDVRLSNMPIINANTSNKNKIKKYSNEFLAELPIKYLLQQAQKHQQNFAGLFSPLLRLLATHFPHLSLVDDWLDDEDLKCIAETHTRTISEAMINDTLSVMATCPSHTSQLLMQLLSMLPTQIWSYAHTIIAHFRNILDPGVPRHVQELYKQVWLKLNTVLPRCLWVMTINALVHEKTMLPNINLNQENIILDPLQVLRCDTRVFRCAPILKVLLHVLQACLAASRSQLHQHIQENPLNSAGAANTINNGTYLTSEHERDDLKHALIAAQESVAVQILLEACQETYKDREVNGQFWALREVRSVICSFLHQIFIAEPNLVKLVHFQGYPCDLLPVSVPGIPSMHICLDFIPELLSQPSLDKQIFAVDLISYLSIQYALPKSMSVARLAVNTLSTLLTVLCSDSRVELFVATLPALARTCKAFPPLIEDVVSLLIQLGRICISEASLTSTYPVQCWSTNTNNSHNTADSDHERNLKRIQFGQYSNEYLCQQIQDVFEKIIAQAVLETKVY